MDSQPPRQRAPTVEPEGPSESDIFATLHHLVSRIDSEDRLQEVADKAQGLQPDDTQLLLDCLSLALDKNTAPLKNRLYAWRALIKVVSSAKVFAQNHTLRAEQLVPENGSSSNVYGISGESSAQIKVLKQAKDQLYGESLISWTHLSHPNIIPLYSVFLQDQELPYIAFPCLVTETICDFVRGQPQVSRMPLVRDLVNGLFYIHQLDIVHGGLHPDNVLISSEGRALIANPFVASDQDSYPLPVRYSAPELLGENDNIQATKAIDMWSFACLCYEVLSLKKPFYQLSKDFRVSGAISQGSKPIRPGQEGAGGDDIDDVIWQILLMCWKFEPDERPACLKVHQIFLGMGVQDDRPSVRPMVGHEILKGSAIDVEHARAQLAGVFGSDYASSLRVPDNLRESLLRLIPDTAKYEATATAAKKLSPNETQYFVDFLDLVLEDLPDPLAPEWKATRMLLSTLMMSTRIIPQRYILNGVQYDSQEAIASGGLARSYKGRGLKIRVSVVTESTAIRELLKLMPNWSHSSHPNVIPFHGVFHENINQAPQLCVVTPLWANGNLRNYARTLSRKSRMLLILDVSNGLNYLHKRIGFVYGRRPITPEHVLISDKGHAVLVFFATYSIFTSATTSPTYELRFSAPDVDSYFTDDIWALGCLCYEVLSRKTPYFQYTEAAQIQSAVSEGERPVRPDRTDDDMEEIDDQAWEFIASCCSHAWRRRPTAPEAVELIGKMATEDDRPEAETLPGVDVLALRSRPDVNFPHIDTMLDKIQVELLRSPLSKLVQSRIKDVAAAATELQSNDIRTLVDFLDLALKNHLSISEERNRVLALLSKITSSTLTFPQRYEVKGIKYRPTPIAEGGFGTVHEGLDLSMCVKVMSRVDSKALTEWIKELILWAHSSHPNVLPFYGVFLEGAGDSQRICLVSPFMKNGNLHDYAPRLPQKSRLSLILDVIKGLHYLHGLGIVHGDLKGQNVLISDEGRGFITDFGASHIITATFAATTSSVFSTLRFAAPELMQDDARPSKECDVWSFGCLCYQVLSRKVPYHQYTRDFQVAAALSRKELLKRPGPTNRNGSDESDEDDWDEDEDWDPIDDPAWNLITKCCAPEPEDRVKVSAIQELIADMKVWDDRPPMKAVPGAEIFKLKMDPEIDLNRAGDIIEKLQTMVAPSDSGPQRDFTDVFNDLW